MNAIAKPMTDPAYVARLKIVQAAVARLMMVRPAAWVFFDRLDSMIADELAKSATPIEWARNRVAEAKRKQGLM